jgi:hypothetical protein
MTIDSDGSMKNIRNYEIERISLIDIINIIHPKRKYIKKKIIIEYKIILMEYMNFDPNIETSGNNRIDKISLIEIINIIRKKRKYERKKIIIE